MEIAQKLDGLVTLTKEGKTICEDVKAVLALEPPIEHRGNQGWVHGWHIDQIHAPILFSAAMYTDEFDFENKDTWFDVTFKAADGETYTGRGFKTLMVMDSQIIDLQGAEPLTKLKSWSKPMTDQEKQGVLESFEAMYKNIEGQDNSSQFQRNANQLLAAAGNLPLPYVNAAVGELEKVSQAKETKAGLLSKIGAAIEFIKASPAKELNHERIKAYMDKA
jgi:hypothetical protein